MDMMGTVEHRYDSPRLDAYKHQAEKAKAEGKVYPAKPQKVPFTVDGRWTICFGGADYENRRK